MPAAESGTAGLRLIVLGSAAGGGVPQWNCGCGTCRAAWADASLQSGQLSLAASGDGGRNWILVNASPDLRAQVLATPQLHPRPGRLRDTPIAGVILTNGEVDAVAGLLSMREGSPFVLMAHPRVLDILDANPIFEVLDRERVPRRPMAIGEPFEPLLPDGSPSGLVVEAFDVPGKVAWFLEGSGAETAPGDTLGLTLRARGAEATVHVVPACAALSPALAERLRGAGLVLFDGTLWSDDEMIREGLGQKTGQRMGHMAMSGPGGALEALGPLGIRQKAFVHVNNSNPALRPGTAERRAVEAAGWIIPRPGQEFTA
jgi:pyrroloquinoline quinone biosynthesis protein B